MELIHHHSNYQLPEDDAPKPWYKRLSNTTILLVTCLIGQLIFIADLVIPAEREFAFIMTETEYNQIYNSGVKQINNSTYLYTTLGKVRIDEKEINLFSQHSMVYVRKSRINHVITEISKFKAGHWVKLKSIINIFFPFIFFPGIGFLAALLGLISKRLIPDEQGLDFKFAILAVLFFLITSFVYAIT